MVCESSWHTDRRRTVVARKIVVVGGGAAGMGAAGGIKAVDPTCQVTVYTGFDDVAYSPCGIPYVHGREIDSFERLFLASKKAYVDAGIDEEREPRCASGDGDDEQRSRHGPSPMNLSRSAR